ncbi:hypothetical protein K663_12855 [Sphingobium sp. MI1205]|nr:hypothetical protein K663_12855 [Sphingobium sp. MI1205]
MNRFKGLRADLEAVFGSAALVLQTIDLLSQAIGLSRAFETRTTAETETKAAAPLPHGAAAAKM